MWTLLKRAHSTFAAVHWLLPHRTHTENAHAAARCVSMPDFSCILTKTKARGWDSDILLAYGLVITSTQKHGWPIARVPPRHSVHSQVSCLGSFYTRTTHYSHFQTPFLKEPFRYDRFKPIPASLIIIWCGLMGVRTSKVMLIAHLAIKIGQICLFTPVITTYSHHYVCEQCAFAQCPN